MRRRAKQAQSRLKQIEKLEDDGRKRPAASVRASCGPYVRFDFEKPSGRDVLRMEGVKKASRREAFGDNVIFNEPERSTSTAATASRSPAANGVGKSVLLKLLVGALLENLDRETRRPIRSSPDAGARRAGVTTRASATSRRTTTKPSARPAKGYTAYEWLYGVRHDEASAGRPCACDSRAPPLFQGEAALKPTEALSGGEAARLLLGQARSRPRTTC